MLAPLLERFESGDRLALARLLSLASRGEHLEEILAAVKMPATPARVVALTGAGGVGKSTLTGRLIETVRSSGKKVAVLACDPQSPLSGGALLGDRFRMPAHAEDDGVYIRSLAAAGGQGAMASHLGAMIRLVESFGFEVVLVETVGAGQGDTAVRGLVDVLVLLLQPETGDDLQWEKAGLLEVADVVAIHKADLPGAERVEAQVLSALALTGGAAIPVVRVSSRSGVGIGELWKLIEGLPLRRGQRRDAEELLRLTRELLTIRFASRPEPLRGVLDRWQRGELSPDDAAREVLRVLVS